MIVSSFSHVLRSLSPRSENAGEDTAALLLAPMYGADVLLAVRTDQHVAADRRLEPLRTLVARSQLTLLEEAVGGGILVPGRASGRPRRSRGRCRSWLLAFRGGGRALSLRPHGADGGVCVLRQATRPSQPRPNAFQRSMLASSACPDADWAKR